MIQSPPPSSPIQAAKNALFASQDNFSRLMDQASHLMGDLSDGLKPNELNALAVTDPDAYNKAVVKMGFDRVQKNLGSEPGSDSYVDFAAMESRVLVQPEEKPKSDATDPTPAPATATATAEAAAAAADPNAQTAMAQTAAEGGVSGASGDAKKGGPSFEGGGGYDDDEYDEEFFAMLMDDGDEDGDGLTELDEFYRARAKGLVPASGGQVRAALTLQDHLTVMTQRFYDGAKVKEAEQALMCLEVRSRSISWVSWFGFLGLVWFDGWFDGWLVQRTANALKNQRNSSSSSSVYVSWMAIWDG